MSGWIEYEHGAVKIKHHSTSSLIEMIITTYEEVEEGKSETIRKVVWFDYNTFSDLREVMTQITFP